MILGKDIMNKEDMYQREQNKKAALAAQQEAYKRYRLCDRMIAQLHWKATHMDNKKAKKDLSDGVCDPSKHSIHKLLVR